MMFESFTRAPYPPPGLAPAGAFGSMYTNVLAMKSAAMVFDS